MRRREFITLVGGSAAAWPFALRAEQPVLPVVGFIRDGSAAPPRRVAAFRKGLNETGYVEGQNVRVEYHWLQAQHERLPPLIADLGIGPDVECPHFGQPRAQLHGHQPLTRFAETDHSIHSYAS